MMSIKDIHKIVFADAVLNALKEYKEVISDPGISDHATVMAEHHAFNDILVNVKWYEDKEGAL